MIAYHLMSIHDPVDAKADFQRIIDYLLTFVGDVDVTENHEGHATISYNDTSTTATIATTGNCNRQMTLTCEKNDVLSVHLVKTVAKNIGYRIFSSQTLSYLVNDPNVLDLTAAEFDEDIAMIMNQYGLTPLFQYRDSLVFYVKDASGRMHLVNRHLLEFLRRHPRQKLYKKEFSVVVAHDIGRFVALFDRGLIPLSFYKCVYEPKKIINLSGFNIDRLHQNVIIEQINFVLDLPQQTFVQTSAKEIRISRKTSLIRALDVKRYLAVKVAQDIGYHQEKQQIMPILSVSVFLDA